MNRTKVNKSVNSQEPTNPEETTPTTDEQTMDRKRPNRKGKQAQQRSNEKFRLKQNQKTQAGIDKMIEDTKEKLRINVEKAFGSRIPPGIVKPVIEVKPDTWTLPDICDKVVNVLETAGKIRFDAPLQRDQAVTALQVISAAQMEAKIFFSRIGSPHRHPWEYHADYHQRMEYYAGAFPRNFTPIVNYIDQFGKFSLNGQEFIPWSPSNDEEYANNMCTCRSIDITTRSNNPGLQGWEKLEFLLPVMGYAPPPGIAFQLPNQYGPNGRPVYMVVENAEQAVAAGIIDDNNQLLPGAPPLLPGVINYQEAVEQGFPPEMNFDQCVENFAALQTRVARKFKLSWPELDMKSGRGTPIQLVASEDEANGFRRAWSSREVGTDVLTLGAIFNSAPQRPDRMYAIYDPDIASVQADVQVKSALSTYVDTIHGDFVSYG